MYLRHAGGGTESGPHGVAVSKEGEIAVSDNKNSSIVMFDKTGNFSENCPALVTRKES